MAKSKFFRVFVEGDTTDGRVIERSWIQDIVDTYNTATYGARVWIEHMRSALPDGLFRAQGDVLAVKAEEVEIPGFGKKLALFAQIDPTDELVKTNKARQKLFTSAEIQPNFANSGKCYLTGLAVTDSPASLGTEMLAFAAGAEINPLAARKQDPSNLFTVANEFTLELDEDDKPSEDGIGVKLFNKVMGMLKRQDKSNAEDFNGISQAVETIAESQSDVLTQFAELKGELAKANETIVQLQTESEEQKNAFAELKQQLDEEPSSNPRKPATGGNGAVKTDC